MTVNREQFKSITDAEYTEVQNLVRENEAAVEKALSASGAVEVGSEIYQTSHSFYSNFWNANIERVDAKLKRRKTSMRKGFQILLIPTLAIFVILALYWSLSVRSDVNDKLNVLIFSGYMLTAFWVFAGTSILSDFRRYRRDIKNYRFNKIFHEDLRPALKTAMVPGLNELHVAKVSGETVVTLQIPYSEIFTAAIVPINSRAKLVRNNFGSMESLSIEERLEDDVENSEYDEVRVFKNSGRRLSLLEPEGRNGGTRETLTHLIHDRAKKAAQ